MTDPVVIYLDDTFGTAEDDWTMPKTVKHVMHGMMPLVSAGVKMTDTIEKMTAGKFGCVGVVDSAGHLMGIITDGDLRRHMDSGLFHSVAADIMTWRPVTIGQDAAIQEALDLMNKRKITVIFVVDDMKPVGIVHIHDLVAAGA